MKLATVREIRLPKKMFESNGEGGKLVKMHRMR